MEEKHEMYEERIYEMIHDLLLGIKTVTNILNKEYEIEKNNNNKLKQDELINLDIKNPIKMYRFPSYGSDYTPKHEWNHFEFEIYYPFHFYYLQSLFNCQNFLIDLMETNHNNNYNYNYNQNNNKYSLY